MALDVGGRHAEADRAYEWLVDLQRDDGSWHQYYIAGDDGSTQVEQDKLDANVCAYVAAGVWHRWLLTDDKGFVEDDVAGGREGHRLRARPPDAARRDPLGPPRRRHPVELRPPHRLELDLPQPPLRHRHRPAARPRAPRLGDLAPPGSPTSSATCPRRSRRSTAGRWTGTTRCSAAWCSARPAAGGSTSARTPSSWTAGACAACPTARGSPSPRPASAPWPTSPSATARWPTPSSAGPSSSATTRTAATGPAPSSPTRPASPAASAAPTPPPASSSAPTPSPAPPPPAPLRRDAGVLPPLMEL